MSRIAFNVQATDFPLFEAAAKLSGMSIRQFVIEAARARARIVLSQHGGAAKVLSREEASP